MNAFAPSAAAAHTADLLTAEATLTRAMADEKNTAPADHMMLAAAYRWESLAHHLSSGATCSTEFITTELAAADALMARAGARALPAAAEKILAAYTA